MSSLSGLTKGQKVEVRAYDHINDQWVWCPGVVVHQSGKPTHASYQKPWFNGQLGLVWLEAESVEWRFPSDAEQD